jgi:hypothetical protein
MSISLSSSGTILVEGACPSEDAEPLLQLLLSTPGAVVDWRHCSAAHSAVVQVLMAARPIMLGPPAGAALARWMNSVVAGDSRQGPASK